jgi:hypothetical protein
VGEHFTHNLKVKGLNPAKECWKQIVVEIEIRETFYLFHLYENYRLHDKAVPLVFILKKSSKKFTRSLPLIIKIMCSEVFTGGACAANLFKVVIYVLL